MEGTEGGHGERQNTEKNGEKGGGIAALLNVLVLIQITWDQTNYLLVFALHFIIV